MQNAECRMQNEIIRLLSNSHIQTNIVENLGSWPLNSFGSTFPSIVGSFPKQMFALVKIRQKTFLLLTLRGTIMFALPTDGSHNQLVGKFLKILKKLFSKSFLSGCGQSPRPSQRPSQRPSPATCLSILCVSSPNYAYFNQPMALRMAAKLISRLCFSEKDWISSGVSRER